VRGAFCPGGILSRGHYVLDSIVAYLLSHVPEFIEPENWPPNSPDLNPVDYSLCGALQQTVYRHKISH